MMETFPKPVTLARRRLLLAIAAALPAASLTACACNTAKSSGVQPLGQRSFEQYASDTKAWIEKERRWVNEDRTLEYRANVPSESRPIPSAANGGGILAIHGLGDSPWSFVDQAEERRRAGWLVRTVLLPGCGTNPEDMIDATADDWRRVVREQAAILKLDLEARYPGKPHPLWLAGFSTGCNLALEAALEGGTPVDGLILFSPAVIVRTHLSFMAPILAPFVTWLREPEKSRNGGKTALRYTTVPMQGLAAFVDTMRGAESALKRKRFDKPAVVMLSEHDSVLDTQALVRWLPERLTAPQSRFIWYGKRASLGKAAQDPRVIVYTDNVPEEHISSFSHMAMTYSPENPEYGRNGRSRMCSLDGGPVSAQVCSFGQVTYGAWGDPNRGKLSARLTFNPYFSEQQRLIDAVMKTTL